MTQLHLPTISPGEGTLAPRHRYSPAMRPVKTTLSSREAIRHRPPGHVGSIQILSSRNLIHLDQSGATLPDLR
jgi:hypothetical protein